MTNLLTQPLIETTPGKFHNLPGVLAALSRDEVDSFPALRPHQRPAWHMFLVQLAALALRQSDTTVLPETEAEWARQLRGLTAGFPEDEPWHLIVDDWSRPAFLQPPVPEGAKLDNRVTSPDALDLLITSRNHDLKQSIARQGLEQDWIFALISLQTSEGYGGAGNHGIARMNGGSSSRAMLTLAPLAPDTQKSLAPRPGARFRRDVKILLATRDQELAHSGVGYAEYGGLGLTWLAPWPEGEQLQLPQLDIWFIEVCRRVRLDQSAGRLSARKGTSKASRVNAKHCNGVLGDPFAPVNEQEQKSLTLGEGRFDYHRLYKLLFSGEWTLPVLARPSSGERNNDRLVLVAEAIGRGNSKTFGFQSRLLPVRGSIAYRLFDPTQRADLHSLAKLQMEEIAEFTKALRSSLALVAAGGEQDSVSKGDYEFAKPALARFDTAVDAFFFEHLWRRVDAHAAGDAEYAASKRAFAEKLYAEATSTFDAALPAIPCASMARLRAEVRARRYFHTLIRRSFPDYFRKASDEEIPHDAE